MSTPGTSYLSYRKDGTFDQLRVFGDDRIPKFDIDYGIHQGVQPHRHVYLNHDKNSPGVPPTASEEALKYDCSWQKYSKYD